MTLTFVYSIETWYEKEPVENASDWTCFNTILEYHKSSNTIIYIICNYGLLISVFWCISFGSTGFFYHQFSFIQADLSNNIFNIWWFWFSYVLHFIYLPASIIIFHVGNQENVHRNQGNSEKTNTEGQNSCECRGHLRLSMVLIVTDVEPWKNQD